MQPNRLSVYNPWKSSTPFKPFKVSVHFHPDHFGSVIATEIYCSADNNGPCPACKEFQELQPKIAKAQAGIWKWEDRLQDNNLASYRDRERYKEKKTRYKSEFDTHKRRDVEVRLLINDRHFPMNRLPVELLCKIFELYIYSAPIRRQCLPQITLLSVCKQWRDVATRTPKLWTTFPVPSITRSTFCREQIALWLRRSKPYPISLEFKHQSINACRPWDDREELESDYYFWLSDRRQPHLESQEADIARDVMRHKDRIYAINLQTLPYLKNRMISGAFEQKSIWPMLSRITMKSLMVYEAVEVLRRCPQATVVEFIDLYGNRTSEMTRVRTVHLRSLKLVFCQSPHVDPAAFLDFIVAPALKEVICQSDSDIRCMPALEVLFRRSACSIHTLHFRLPEFRRNELISVLASQPSLRTCVIAWRPFTPEDVAGQRTIGAFDTLMRLLLTDKEGKMGIGREYTTGNFLPCLETIKYIGKMMFSWNSLKDVYTSHAGILENLNWPEPFNVDSSTHYRPLRLIKFRIIERDLGLLAVNENGNGAHYLSYLTSLPSNPHYCRFEYDFHDNERLVYMD